MKWKHFNIHFILNKVHDMLHPLSRQEIILLMILQYFKTFIIQSFDSCEKKQMFI